jgi:MFS family permease
VQILFCVKEFSPKMIKLITSQFFASLSHISAGTAYVFSLYGTQLQRILKTSQTQTSFIAGCGNAGIFLCGPLFGILCDRYPKAQFLFHLFGGLMIAAGYYTISLTAQKLITVHYLLIAFIYFLIGAGSSSVYHSALSTNYRNWPQKYRSVAVGLTVSFFGLSAFIFTFIAKTWFMTDIGKPLYTLTKPTKILKVDSFLQLIAAVCLAINILTAIFFKRYTNLEQSSDEERQPLLQPSIARPPPPVLNILPPEAGFDDYQEEQEEYHTPLDATPVVFEASLEQVWQDQTEGSEAIELQDISCFHSYDAYLLGYSMCVLAGAGLMWINHIGVIIISLAEGDARDPLIQSIQTYHVGVLSLLSFTSRIGFGILADYLYSIAGVTLLIT